MTPYGISGDGMVAAGYKNGRPLAWTQTGGVVDLGDLGASYGAARGVSADGTIIIGESSVLASNGFGWGPISFRWTASDGMVAIDPNDGPAGAGTYSSANAISADGSTVAGRTSRFRTSGSGPYLWTESGGMIDLGYLDDASSYGSAYACSSDGAVVAGMNNSTLGNQAFRWTEALGMQGLGDLTGGDFESHAYGVSGDGTVIIGKGTTAIGDEAFIWDEVNGMRNLKTVLTDDFGLDLTGWTLLSAEGISADGNSIVGYGLNPSGMREGWVAVTPEPATLALLAMGAVAMLRRRKGGMSR
jgi:probable HAF family extracellular repeat protein